MNKDLARFVKKPAGFIINYEVKDGIIYVTTPETIKAGKPQEYPATKEKIQEYEVKLESQYQMVIKKQDEIIENKNKLTLTVAILPLVLGISSALATIVSEMLGVALCIAAVSSLVLGVAANAIAKQKEKAKLAVYDAFLKNRRRLEQVSKNDKNITLNISKEAKDNINKNKKLRATGLIDNILNVNFMDKTALKDLKEMLLRLKVSESLQEEVEFQMPEEKSSIISTYSRVRKPKKNKKK